MFWRRLGYLLITAGCLIFYWAYREWLSGLLLVFVLVLPWFSLLVSLPSMLTARLTLRTPRHVTLGEDCPVLWQVHCPLPVAPVRGRVKLRNLQTDQTDRLRQEYPLDSSHCGGWELTPKKVWVRDYFGLFSLPVWRKAGAVVSIRPRAIPMDNPPDVLRYRSCAFRPKPGGGYAEQHEMRLYRPGDQLRQVHWKLSAKAGKLVIREPMEPLRGKALVTLVLSGTPEVLDKKLGNLVWLSLWLLEQEIPHSIQCLTGSGMQSLEVACPEDAWAAIDQLLLCPLAGPEANPVFAPASWHCHIGGAAHES